MNTDWLFWAGGTIIALAGVTLAAWALFADRSRGRRRCPMCWYDLSKTEGLRCPECGHQAKRESKLFKTRRQWRWVAVGILVMLMAAVLGFQPNIRRNGWESLLPTTVVILGLRQQDNINALRQLEIRNDRIGEHAFYDWQWRMIGNTCAKLLEQDRPTNERLELASWLASAIESAHDQADVQEMRSVLENLLMDSDPMLRRSTSAHVAFVIEPLRASDLITPLLNDPDQRVQSSAVFALGIVDRRGGDEDQRLLELLQHPNTLIRETAAGAIGNMAVRGTALPAAFDALRTRFHVDPVDSVRSSSLRAMTYFANRRNELLPCLEAALNDESVTVRVGALDDLQFCKNLDEAFVANAVIHRLRDADEGVRLLALTSLDRLDPETLDEHRDNLLELTKSEDAGVVRSVRYMLYRMNEIQDP